MTAKIYCPSMWKSVHIDTDGYLTPCCLFVQLKHKRTKITDVKHISNVLEKEFAPYREQLSKGEWPEGCNQCKFAEQEGRSSKREQDVRMFSGNMSNDLLEQVKLEYLQLKTGRLCNLRCTICTPACSTSIAVEQLKSGKLSRESYDIYQKDIAWSYDINEYNKMNPPSGSYFRIDIAGGEPLMNKTHFEWLDKLPNTKETQLLYNTNGTQRPTREEIDIWKKYKGIWLAFSIDSYGKKFEELRVGAEWEQVLANLKYCQEEIVNKEFDKNSNCSVVMTISKYNVMDVFELSKIITDNVNFNHEDPINFNYLFYPEHLACHNMSKNEIKKVIEFYDENLHTLDINSKMYRQSKDLRDSLESFLVDKTVG